MTVFADASALVKLYADESDSASVAGLDPVVVSAVSRVEVPAALWRKVRTGELTPDDARLLVAEFEADWFGDAQARPRFVAAAVTPRVLDDAAGLTGSHGLRAYDAVQLASARAATAADPGCDHFAAFDSALRRAALVEGYVLVPT